MTTYVFAPNNVVQGAPYVPNDGHTLEGDWPADMVPSFVDVTGLPSVPVPGSTYDPVAKTFTPPVPVVPEVPPPPTSIAPLDFMARLTAAEQTAIATAGQSNAQVFLFLLKLAGAEKVNVNDPLTQAGVAAMVTAGLLTQARATQMLDLTQASPPVAPATTP